MYWTPWKIEFTYIKPIGTHIKPICGKRNFNCETNYISRVLLKLYT